MFSKNLTLFILFICMVLSCGCEAKSSTQKLTVCTSTGRDSVLFTMQNRSFKASFSEVQNSGRGSANGSRLFQRRGSLRFVLSELYGDNPINLQNNPNPRKSYKVDISWYKKADFKKVRRRVLSKIKEILNYQITRKNTTITTYDLMISNSAKLRRAISKNSLSGGANYKSTINNGQWNIIASLPTFATKLSEKLNKPVRARQRKLAMRYHFELNLKKDKVELEQQLKEQYGIVLKKKKKPVKRINIVFKLK